MRHETWPNFPSQVEIAGVVKSARIVGDEVTVRDDPSIRVGQEVKFGEETKKIVFVKPIGAGLMQLYLDSPSITVR